MEGKMNKESDLISKNSYGKRIKTLLQKIEEIATLCGVEASLIIYSELEEGGGPVTWPANARQVQGVVDKMKSTIEMGMSRPKVEDVESLVEARLEKEKLKLAKLQLNNEDKETRLLMSECLAGKGLSSLSMAELTGLSRLLCVNLNILGDQISHLTEEDAMGVGLNVAGRRVEDQPGPSGTKDVAGSSGDATGDAE